MPYTPPSQQSPASSKTTSPAVSRTSSYSEESSSRSPVTGRPQPPRSSHSASYLTKHRRSPSITTPAAESSYSAIRVTDFAHFDSVRQSPPPVNKNRIPAGAVISPPDSSENSDGDEATKDGRGRDLDRSWDQLKEAVRAIDQRRESSPDKNNGIQAPGQTLSEPVSQSTSPAALTAEARKISHSRSSTETSLVIPRTDSFTDSPIGTSDDSDEEQLMMKPSLVRKKSGELVKPALRPSSRRRYSSMPGTPTYHKSVHFNDNGNQTRHFLQVDKPIAVSAGTSPVETYDSESEYPFENNSTPEREIRLTNFPTDTFERRTNPVRVERIFLSQDKQTLIGTVAVQNLSFHKVVVARFTLDYWQTTSEVVAEYNNVRNAAADDICDRFNFQVKLSDQANIDTKTLLLCVKYTVNGVDYWDNNDNCNYQIDFIRGARKVVKPTVNTGLGTRPLNALPRSRHSPSRSHGRPDSIDDDFASRSDSESSYHFGNVDNILGESAGSIKLKPKRGRGSLFQHNTGAAPANGLGGRYDFGASLSAALSTAQDKLGRQSGLMGSNSGVAKSTSGCYFGPLERKEGPTKTDERPDMLTTDRPAMGSDQYRDLVQKFCYFTPGSGKMAGSVLVASARKSNLTSNSTDGAADLSSAVSSQSSSGHCSPTMRVESKNDSISPALSPFISRAASPARITGQDLAGRASSPIQFGYPYHSNARDGYLSDSSNAPTAIRG